MLLLLVVGGGLLFFGVGPSPFCSMLEDRTITVNEPREAG